MGMTYSIPDHAALAGVPSFSVIPAEVRFGAPIQRLPMWQWPWENTVDYTNVYPPEMIDFAHEFRRKMSTLLFIGTMGGQSMPNILSFELSNESHIAADFTQPVVITPVRLDFRNGTNGVFVCSARPKLETVAEDHTLMK
jgi:hypothetical protein